MLYAKTRCKLETLPGEKLRIQPPKEKRKQLGQLKQFEKEREKYKKIQAIPC